MAFFSRFIFEFEDLPFLPFGLKHTITDILEVSNSFFRSYNRWVAKETLTMAQSLGCTTIVELGAGAAPITRHCAQRSDIGSIELVPCDLRPDLTAFRRLQAKYPSNVRPCLESVDYTKKKDWRPGTLFVLSATFHHLSEPARHQLLKDFSEARFPVLIFEPLRRNLASVVYCALGLLTFFVPLFSLNSPGLLRRIFWCWLFPIAPLLFAWDGVMSALREWDTKQWKEAHRNLPATTMTLQDEYLCQQMVAFLPSGFCRVSKKRAETILSLRRRISSSRHRHQF